MRYYLIGIEADADANRLEGIQGPLRIGPAWEDQYQGPRIKSLVPVSFSEATALFQGRSARGPLFPPVPSGDPAEERQRTLTYPPQPWAPDEIERFRQSWAREAASAPYPVQSAAATPQYPSDPGAVQLGHVIRGSDKPTYGRCDARARKGTGEGVCDRPLDEHGYCDRPGDHL